MEIRIRTRRERRTKGCKQRYCAGKSRKEEGESTRVTPVPCFLRFSRFGVGCRQFGVRRSMEALGQLDMVLRLGVWVCGICRGMFAMTGSGCATRCLDGPGSAAGRGAGKC